MNNHIYKFGGKLRLQKGNGSIGDRATGIIAQYVMLWWERIFKEKLSGINIENYLLERYIDDINFVTDALEPGTDYVEGKLIKSREKEIEDLEVPADVRTMNVIKKVANEVHDMIKFTTDAPSNHLDNKMPVLDLKVWLDDVNQSINYIFYEKPTKSKLVISKISALPKSTKMKCLTQEVFRRLHNTKESIMEEYKIDILDNYMQKLKSSQYTENERLLILKGGIKTYENLRKLENEGKRPFFRPPETRSLERKKKKDKVVNWFKDKNKENENKFAAVMFVEATPESELVKKLREAENKFKIDDAKRIKFIEKCGNKIIDSIRISDTHRTNCAKETKCLACEYAKSFSNCRKENVGYAIDCLSCKEKGIEKVYEGESSRNMYLRQVEHTKQYQNKDPNSVLLRHAIAEHKDEDPNDVKFQMKLKGTFQTPLQRIINEGVRIKQREPKTLMNSKMEYFGPSVRRKNVN